MYVVLRIEVQIQVATVHPWMVLNMHVLRRDTRRIWQMAEQRRRLLKGGGQVYFAKQKFRERFAMKRVHIETVR